MKLAFSFAVFFSITGLPLLSQNPVELGTVKWQRDIRQATSLAKQKGKPVFILFQEIPGCITCQRYGNPESYRNTDFKKRWQGRPLQDDLID